MRRTLLTPNRLAPARGLVWDCASPRAQHSPARWLCLALLALSLVVVALVPAAAADAGTNVSVIVRTHGVSPATERAVLRLGGSVERRLPLIDGFLATLPASRLERLRRSDGVASVTLDRRVQMSTLDGWDQKKDLGSMHYVAQEVAGAGEFWNDRYTGEGVDVALIDSGVVPVAGLRTPGKVVLRPGPLVRVAEPQAPHTSTRTATGRTWPGSSRAATTTRRRPVQKGDETFVGMAPDARIVSIKVADSQGATDVSQVIAAIDWVVQHRRDNGLNIRVLNLSFGTDSDQDYRVDPLAYAVEIAWRKGIVVVVAAGNGGFGSAGLNSPASSPFAIAVGGADGRGTYDWLDDTVPTWSSWGPPSGDPISSHRGSRSSAFGFRARHSTSRTPEPASARAGSSAVAVPRRRPRPSREPPR